MTRRLLCILASTLPVAGCLNTPLDRACTAIAIAGLSVVVVDSASGVPRAEGAFGTAVEGTYVDTLDTYFGTDSLLVGAWERKGTYTVTVTRPGYRPWIKSNVIVTADECHVQAVPLKARLQPAP